ncbi:MAG: amidohydrolase family protein [Aphanocapsa sp. GSE-SYN-MK-11-07L]|jgi:imidazolonepropionase-like amidohydrolase|nr:amidohydrolase family protein [Aphanocapsa sp. GSE-SYN-MK-11-07L]
MRSLFRKFLHLLLATVIVVAIVGFAAQFSFAQSKPAQTPPTSILFENVRIFNGTAAQLSASSNVLVVDNKIQTISQAAIAAPSGSLTRIKGNGRVLMPGLIDAHTHLFWENTPINALLSPNTSIETLDTAVETTAKNMLLRGFTSARDMAGPVFKVKKAIDAGQVVGPRIYPSGAMISQTSGHGDFRSLSELPRTPTTPRNRSELLGATAIADGVDEVLRATREQLMQGASQIKLAAGGGVASSYDPLDVSQYTESELRAAVEAATSWNTYVAVHAYTPTAMQLAIRAGVKAIEHGHLMDEQTAKLMAERGIWLSMQPFLDDEDAIPVLESSRSKQLQLFQGTDITYKLAKQYNLKTAWGTDTQFEPKLAPRQGAQLAKMVRWYTPAEVLKMATSTNAQLLAMSGPRNPYPGKLGVVEEGALADLLLVNGDPLANIKLIENPDKNFSVIMKDGKIYKNAIR